MPQLLLRTGVFSALTCDGNLVFMVTFFGNDLFVLAALKALFMAKTNSFLSIHFKQPVVGLESSVVIHV